MSYIFHKVEAAQVFDELSILEIKKLKSTNEDQRNALGKQINIIKEEISNSIGDNLANEIYSSEFYAELLNSNLNIFNSVDKFKMSEPAQLNMKRIEAKRSLQESFFKKSLEEIKI